MIRDLTDDELRAASPLKWGMTPEGVIPAWVAEMDYAPAEPVLQAVRDAVDRGALGYPPFELGGGDLGDAYAGFAKRHFAQEVDPRQVIPTVDVTAGVRLALDVLGRRQGADGAAAPGVPPAARPRAGHRARSSGTCRSRRTATPTRSTSTTSTGCSPRARARCC